MTKEEEAKARLWDEVGAPLMRAGFQMAIQEMIELVANIEAMDPNAYSLLCDKLVSMASEQKNASKNQNPSQINALSETDQEYPLKTMDDYIFDYIMADYHLRNHSTE